MNVRISNWGLILVISDNTINQFTFMKFAGGFERTWERC